MNRQAPTPRVGKCYVCKGRVTENYTHEYIPGSGPKIYGPGGASQYAYVSTGLYCETCGIKYAKLPPETSE
jgi:hypothetical protein